MMRTHTAGLLPAALLMLAYIGCVSGGLELVEEGKSDFTVYVDPSSHPTVHAAADTMVKYIEDISGARLEITDERIEGGRQIVLEVGMSADRALEIPSLGKDGFRIKTAGGSLFITAGTGRGISNAVYTFLETYLGCRKYTPEVTFIPLSRTITLPGIDDTQVPPVEFRLQHFHEQSYAAWHKLDDLDDWGLFVHTFATLVPPEKYFEEHPEYFTELNGTRIAGGQLCLTNPDVFRIVVEELHARMKEEPEAIFWSVSQNDTYCPCGCEACRKIDDAEGSPSGSIISFVNRIADEFPGRNISTLAYQYSRAAPKHVRPRPNVNIMLCSIECNRSRPLAEDTGSASFARDVAEWGRLTDNIFLWDYVIQFRNLVSPFPNLRVLQPNIQFFVMNGIKSIYQQGLPVMRGEFAELRIYLISKILWDPYVDVDSVMDDFLAGYYGTAAPHIRRYIDTMHDALEDSGEELLIYGYPSPSRDGYLSAGMIDRYIACFDKAEEAVMDDPELLFRVRTTRLPLQFALLEQAKVYGTAERGCFVENRDGTLAVKPEIATLLDTFVTRCLRADIPRLWERGTTPEQYDTMTRAFFDQSGISHLAKSKPVHLAEPASPKYHGGDGSALTNGLKGWDDYHMHWLGFEGTDMEATIDLGSVRTVTSISTDFLQDIESWIFMPITVKFALSEDGLLYRSAGGVRNTVPEEKYGAIIAPFAVQFEPSQARYIKVTAAGLKTCPAWHKGSGGLAWIFIDEITVK